MGCAGYFPHPATNRYATQVATALQYAHNRQILHRNLHPREMLLDEQGNVLVDFSGSPLRFDAESHPGLEWPPFAAAYLAPEALDAQWQTASDQYALAAVVYRWLSGELPFQGSSFPEVAVQHVRHDPSSLCAKVPSLPPEVEQVVLKALAKDPKERFPNIQAFAAALEEASHAA